MSEETSAEQKGKQPQAQPQPQQQAKAKKDETSIVRIAGRDINGNYKISKALDQVKGIGNNMANAIMLVAQRKFNINPESKIGSLGDKEISEIESIMKDPIKFGIPSYFVNRNKDRETGSSMHIIGSDLTVRVKQDVDNDIKLQTYRGFRHQYGQKVRGQKTRSTGRTGATVGVTKKTAEAAMKKTAEAAKDKEKK
ncbi:MAG: 30S ribosomal protein S13 [Candidatus Micrarchaeia archaeon]